MIFGFYSPISWFLFCHPSPIILLFVFTQQLYPFFKILLLITEFLEHYVHTLLLELLEQILKIHCPYILILCIHIFTTTHYIWLDHRALQFYDRQITTGNYVSAFSIGQGVRKYFTKFLRGTNTKSLRNTNVSMCTLLN